ncbi:hypothetical protein EI94DRAFT_1702009 [Lactarius quietus]|nr:hypothetical protein EI94DRAFT_1702009 [Lactarius quietus]
MGGPDMGDAATHTVHHAHPIPLYTHPDAGLVFATLLKAKRLDLFFIAHSVRHPAVLSNLMFSFSALVVYTVFRTSYGNSFAEERLVLLPLAVAVLFVLFSWNHNYIADKLEINERETYIELESVSNIPWDYLERRSKISDQDEDVFQTALLRHSRSRSPKEHVGFEFFRGVDDIWAQEVRNLNHKPIERDHGNVCSVEFNCIYRWHATTSEADENLDAVDWKVRDQEPDLTHWTFGKLQRKLDGAFNDRELASIIKDARVVLLDNCGRPASNTAESSILPQPLGLAAFPRSWGNTRSWALRITGVGKRYHFLFTLYLLQRLRPLTVAEAEARYGNPAFGETQRKSEKGCGNRGTPRAYPSKVSVDEVKAEVMKYFKC